MRVAATLAQVDARAVEALERIAAAQLVMAVVLALLGVLVLGVTLLALLQLRSLRGLLGGVTETVEELRPHLLPIVDRAKHVAEDVSGMTDNVRRRVDDVLHTVEELHRTVKKASTATEERVRRFGAVLDVVQTEAEELLLDAAATARGVHETARALREPRRTARRRTGDPEQEDFDEKS
jgi:uncharacterized protein YoxC